MSAPPDRAFFTDRDLGAHIFSGHLRAAGLRVERHVDYFVDDARDEDWLPEVARRGWVILTSDQRIMRKPVERDAVMVSGARLLVLVGANAPAAELAVNFVNTRGLIEAFLTEHPSPFIAKVYRPSPGPVTPGGAPGRIEMKMTHEGWLLKVGGREVSAPSG